MPEDPSEQPGVNLGLTNTQLFWMRSDLANLRTLLAWVRTSGSMIGFGFTIYNFYRRFLEDLASPGAPTRRATWESPSSGPGRSPCSPRSGTTGTSITP